MTACASLRALSYYACNRPDVQARGDESAQASLAWARVILPVQLISATRYRHLDAAAVALDARPCMYEGSPRSGQLASGNALAD